MEKLAEIEEMNKVNRRMSVKGGNDSPKPKPQADEDAEWVDIVEAKPTTTGVVVTLSFKKGVQQLPKDVHRRQLQVFVIWNYGRFIALLFLFFVGSL